MNELVLNDLEVASVSVVKQAARDFAAALEANRPELFCRLWSELLWVK